MTEPSSSQPDVSAAERSLSGTYVLVLLCAFGLIGLLFWFTTSWNQPLPGAR